MDRSGKGIDEQQKGKKGRSKEHSPYSAWALAFLLGPPEMSSFGILGTEVTPCHRLSNVMSHTRPPTVKCYQLSCFLLAQMSSQWGIVVGLHNVML